MSLSLENELDTFRHAAVSRKLSLNSMSPLPLLAA